MERQVAIVAYQGVLADESHAFRSTSSAGPPARTSSPSARAHRRRRRPGRRPGRRRDVRRRPPRVDSSSCRAASAAIATPRSLRGSMAVRPDVRADQLDRLGPARRGRRAPRPHRGDPLARRPAARTPRRHRLPRSASPSTGPFVTCHRPGQRPRRRASWSSRRVWGRGRSAVAGASAADEPAASRRRATAAGAVRRPGTRYRSPPGAGAARRPGARRRSSSRSSSRTWHRAAGGDAGHDRPWPVASSSHGRRLAGTTDPAERWSSTVVLGDGESALVRPIRPDDAPALAAFHDRQSRESIYRRYFSPKPHLTDADLRALHRGRPRRPRRPRRRALRRVHRLGQLRALGRPRRRRRRVPGRRRPPGQGHRHAPARAPRGDRPGQRHRPLHGRGARRQPPDARRVQPRRVARRAALRERRRRPRLLARRDRGVPRLRRAPRAARRLAGRRPAAAAAHDRRRRGQRRAGLDRPGPVAPRHRGRQGRGVPGQPGPRRRSAAGPLVRRGCRTSPPTSTSPSSPCRRAALPAVIEDCIAARVRGAVIITSIEGTDVDIDAARHPGPQLRRAPDRPRQHGRRRAAPVGRRRRPARAGRPAARAASPSRCSPARSAPRCCGWPTTCTWACRGSCRSATRATCRATTCCSSGRTTRRRGSIAMYTESFGNARKFARIARRVSLRRPIVAVRTGAAAIGPTGGALYQQAGLIEVPTVAAMLDTARVLATQPVMRGPRVALLANARSPHTLSEAALHTAGLEVVPTAPSARLALDAGGLRRRAARRARRRRRRRRDDRPRPAAGRRRRRAGRGHRGRRRRAPPSRSSRC